MKIQRNDFLVHTKFLTMIAISLFYCCETVFTLMDVWEKFNVISLFEKERFL